MSIFGIALNLILAALLVVAVLVGLRLAARLKALKTGQQDFIKAVGELDAAALRAQASLNEMRTLGEQLSDRLSRQVAQAASACEKLERNLDRAERLPERPQIAASPAHELLARAKAMAASGQALSPRLETPRSRARVDDDLFEPQSGGGLRPLPGGRRE